MIRIFCIMVMAGFSCAIFAGNTLLGDNAGFSLNAGSGNTFIGETVGSLGASQMSNTFIGSGTGANNEGDLNTFVGDFSGISNTTGHNSTILGGSAGGFTTTASNNIFAGTAAGFYATTGVNNIFLGVGSGFNNTTGSGNIYIGYTAGFNAGATDSNRLYIDNTDGTVSVTPPLIYGEFSASTLNALIGINGKLGVGTQLPSNTLHIRRADGTAKVNVYEKRLSPAARTLFEIKNNGNTKFTVNNADANVAWAFANSGNDFRLSRQGSGVVEFVLSNAGNLTIQGNLTELSSRTQKHNIVAMSSKQALNKVLTLPIKEWSYKDSQQGTRHIGPMAEDFYAAFGLGESETGIATLDTSGVALAAIQRLKAEHDKKIVQLKTKKEAKILALKAELAELKALVQHLAAKDQWAALN